MNWKQLKHRPVEWIFTLNSMKQIRKYINATKFECVSCYLKRLRIIAAFIATDLFVVDCTSRWLGEYAFFRVPLNFPHSWLFEQYHRRCIYAFEDSSRHCFFPRIVHNRWHSICYRDSPSMRITWTESNSIAVCEKPIEVLCLTMPSCVWVCVSNIRRMSIYGGCLKFSPSVQQKLTIHNRLTVVIEL